jgi:adenine deaminase
VVAGTDLVVPGHSIARELELYVRAGLTPLQAIQSATLVPARVMHLDRESGTLEKGKRADFVVLAGNPLDDIRNLRSVRAVIASGRLFDPAPLWAAAGFQRAGSASPLFEQRADLLASHAAPRGRPVRVRVQGSRA